MSDLAPFPEPLANDAEDVAWALSTAKAMWTRGDRQEAIKWIKRSSDNAADAGDDDRAFDLARAAAELKSALTATQTPSAAYPRLPSSPALPLDPPEATAGPPGPHQLPSLPPLAPPPLPLSFSTALPPTETRTSPRPFSAAPAPSAISRQVASLGKPAPLAAPVRLSPRPGASPPAAPPPAASTLSRASVRTTFPASATPRPPVNIPAPEVIPSAPVTVRRREAVPGQQAFSTEKSSVIPVSYRDLEEEMEMPESQNDRTAIVQIDPALLALPFGHGNEGLRGPSPSPVRPAATATQRPEPRHESPTALEAFRVWVFPTPEGVRMIRAEEKRPKGAVEALVVATTSTGELRTLL